VPKQVFMCSPFRVSVTYVDGDVLPSSIHQLRPLAAFWIPRRAAEVVRIVVHNLGAVSIEAHRPVFLARVEPALLPIRRKQVIG